MTISRLADQFYLYAHTYQIAPGAAYKLLLKIDNSPHHYLPTANMTQEEMDLASLLEEKRWVEFIPAGDTVVQEVLRRDMWGAIETAPRKHVSTPRPLPERYVMLASGNYALGTFDWDTLSEEKREMHKYRGSHPLHKCQLSGHHLRQRDEQGKCTRCGFAGGGR
jgi:hypothetical protein